MSILLREASSVTVPGVLLPQVADSGFLENIGLKDDKLGVGNTSVNITTINPINTATTISQTWHSDREKQGYDVGSIKIPAYVINAHYEYNEREAGIFSKNVVGMSLQNLLSSFCIQATNQRIRQAVFHGLSFNEGLLASATEITFGADGANTTLTSMSPAFVLKKLLQILNDAMSATLNRGSKVVITSSNRVINYLNTSIVPITDYAKGGGTETIALTIKDVISKAYNIECVVVIDSTFENANGDVLSIIIPSLKSHDMDAYSVNYAGKQDNIQANTFIDLGGLTTHQVNPSTNGYVSGNYNTILTSGCVLRGEAVYTTTLQFQ